MTKTLICFLLAATAAQAGITTTTVKVLVTGNCGELKDVYLVINGHDREWVKLDSDGNCGWKKELKGTISTTIATFSLRSGRMRSGCQRASADATQSFANIEFFYSAEDTFRNVSVKIVPPMPVNYVRYVPLSDGGLNPIKCREFATLVDGEGSISNTKFKGGFKEDVYFDFGPFNANRQRLGLLLNDLNDGTLLLTIDGVVYRLTVQRAKGQQRSAPTLSSNAMSLDIKKLADLKFERAEFKVIK